MIDQIKESFKIKDSAIELIQFILFTFATQEELAIMVEDCRDMIHKDINKYVYGKRRTKIASRPYSSLYDFVGQCKEDKHKALEELFQEPLNTSKYALLANIDPSHIHSIHSRQPADIRYMTFQLYL